MAEQNSKVVGGGVVLLMLWGGLGLFFGVGKGKGKGEGKAKEPSKRQSQDPRKKPPTRVAKRKTSPLVRVALRKPTGTAPGEVRSPNSKKAESFTYVLRLRYIHPVSPNGSVSEKTVSIEELIKKGKQAASAKQELHLRVRGDARARWEKKVKQALRNHKVTFSVTNEF